MCSSKFNCAMIFSNEFFVDEGFFIYAMIYLVYT